MTAEQSTITRPLNGKFLAEIVTSGTVAEIAILNREDSRRRVAGAFTFLHSGDVLFDYANDPNGREPNVTFPDENGNPDESVAALLYAGATLEHPFSADGAVGDVKVMVSEHTHWKVRENLGAIGVDFSADAPSPVLDGGNHHRWAEDMPSVSAEKVVYGLGEHFEPQLLAKTPAAV